MLRIMTSFIRNAPGPLKGARALTADLLEGLADVISPPKDIDLPPPSESYAPPEPVSSDEPSEAGSEPAEVAEPAVEEKDTEAVEPEATAEEAPEEPEEDAEDGLDLQAAFDNALEKPGWVRRQDFKVLAIYWQARQQEKGPLTAKKASALGAELGLTIRHENIRKVIRTRLDDKIETSTVEGSQPPTFQYEILDEGVEFFEQEYLAKAEG